MKTYIRRTLPIALLGTSALWARDRDDDHACSLATLKGDYGFSISGTRPSAPNGPLEQIVGVALTTFNGDGTLTQVDNIHGSLSGYPANAVDRPGTGTYTLDEHCNGTMTLNNQGAPTLTIHIVVVRNGNEIRAVVVNPLPVMVTSNGVRVNQ